MHLRVKVSYAGESDKEIQIQLIRTLASPQFMDTQEDERNGTNASSFLRGLDAYVRHFEVVVSRDSVAHIHEDFAQAALAMMERNMHAEVASSVDDALELL